MKVLLKKDFTNREGEEDEQVIGSGTVVTGATAEAALSAGVGEQIEENAPNFNPLPGQGIAAAPFNVNGQPTDPVADQFVGQGTAAETTGTVTGGTQPDPDSPMGRAAAGGEASSPETTTGTSNDQRTTLEQQLANAKTDEERKSIQSQIDSLPTTRSRTAPANKAKGAAPANKGR